MTAQPPTGPFYKVLMNGGESLYRPVIWTLPIQTGSGYEPGEWHECHQPQRPVKLCRNGMHLTRLPWNWYYFECKVYLAEGDGEFDAHLSNDSENKVAFRRARLLEPVPYPSWLTSSLQFIKTLNLPLAQEDHDPNPEWAYHPSFPATLESIRIAREQDQHINTTLLEHEQFLDSALTLNGRIGAYRRLCHQLRNSLFSLNLAFFSNEMVRDFSFYLGAVHTASDLNVPQYIIDDAAKRIEVWSKGYCLICDYDGVMHVYR